MLPLSAFSLHVKEATLARITGILGASGAGKSSLLECVAGLRDASGSVRFGDDTWLDSAAARRVPAERRGIGYVPQDARLFPHLDVRGNLLAGAARARTAGVDVERSLGETAEALGLTGLLHRKPDSLSGGERQRVALGRALCSAPRLLLLDEPFGSLDTARRRGLLGYLRAVCERTRAPVLFVSHDPVEICALAGEAWHIADGRVTARGEPRSVVGEAVFSAENTLVGVVEREPSGTVAVRLAELRIQVPAHELAAGAEVVVVLRPDDVMLCLDEPRAISARNRLPASVKSVKRRDGRALVELELGRGAPLLAAELSEAATRELALEPGRGVFAVFKASSCRVYEL
jgi:molybdate transport system ATP-binding protein